MYDPQNPSHATMYAQAIYAKLQKLSEDIQLQHSIINAQKETVLKSRQRVYVSNPKPEAQGDPTHAVYAHADTVVQHRAMIIKHYELIQQHKQMVKDQGIHVQNLTSTLLNIQQETNVVDELMNTKMAETRTRTSPPTPSPSILVSTNITPPSLSELSSPVIPSSPDICGIKPIPKDAGQNKRKATFQQATQNTQLLLSSLNEDEDEDESETTEDNNNKEDNKNNTIHVSFVSSDNESTKEDPQITSITVTTTSTSTSTTPTSKSLSTITVSSVSTSTSTTTTATTTTTTTFNPSISPPPSSSPIISSNEPLPLSP